MIMAHVRMARSSIKGSRLRSFLTVLGIVIGVASVVLVVSLGEGVKNELTGEARLRGEDVLTIRSGRSIEINDQGGVTGINLAQFLGASTLTEKDVEAIKDSDYANAVAVIGLLAGSPTANDKSYASAYVVAGSANIPYVTGRKLSYGSFFDTDELNRNFAIIGVNVADQLYGDESPVGQTLKFRGNDFIVRGVFEPFKTSSIDINPSYNDAIFIPLGTGKRLGGNVLEIREIQVKVNATEDLEAARDDVKSILLKNHNNQEDFTVLTQQEFISITSQGFRLLTALVAAIAGISLFVGGIGIMNIMLVSVTERTREIGVRKALGATNRQILGQFIVEAIVLSVTGGIIGLFFAGIAALTIASLTPLKPAFSPTITMLALLISVGVGVLFGIMPAVKAARKDPIEALRHD